MNEERTDLFIGRKDGRDQGGVYLYTFENGVIVNRGNVFPVHGFTHIDISDDRTLMAVTGMEGDLDMLYMLSISGETLSLIDKMHINAANDICHVDISHDSKKVVLTDFRDSAVHLVDLDEKGRILSQKRIELYGHSTSFRQEKSHPHSCFFSWDDRFVLASDLGANRVFVIETDGENRIADSWYGKDGIGQRHVAFGRDGNTVFSLCEITGDIGVLEMSKDGKLKELSLDTYMKGYVPDYREPLTGGKVLPDNYLGSADIVVSDDGTKLFVSYRKTKKIAVHAIEGGTDISHYEMMDTDGMVRSVKVSEDSRFIFALGEELWGETGRLEVFEKKEGLNYRRVAETMITDAFIMAVI
ncbi:MAG: beta-propeller fold lactonase family protein [Clostridia bacterium]|nr:beta-propeller fold lactonase family protein [Clostridia bacterium]